MMVICQDDLIQSVVDVFQYIFYYYLVDFICVVKEVYEWEESKVVKDVMVQILVNFCMFVMGYWLICQDIGIVIVFCKVGMNVMFESDMSLDDMINEGVCWVYNYLDNVLCVLVLVDLDGKCVNIKDNILVVINYFIVFGDIVEIDVVVKGGGFEVKFKFVMFNLFDLVVDWVFEQVLKMGVGWCLLGMFGIGIGGIVEKVMLIVKEFLMDLIDIYELQVWGV